MTKRKSRSVENIARSLRWGIMEFSSRATDIVTGQSSKFTNQTKQESSREFK